MWAIPFPNPHANPSFTREAGAGTAGARIGTGAAGERIGTGATGAFTMLRESRRTILVVYRELFLNSAKANRKKIEVPVSAMNRESRNSIHL